MIFFVILLVLTFLAQIAEFFIPPLDWMYNARIYIVPVIVFYGAMALPFPAVMALAFFAGFMLDALTAQVLGTRVEISVGWSILLYAVLAAIMHGLRPLFIRGRWEVHCIMSGVCTSAILLSPIPHDLIPARLAFLHPRSLVANRGAGLDCDDHGAAGLLDPALPRSA